MTILAIIIGILFPAVNGWLLVRLLQFRTRVFDVIEEWAAGFTLGSTFTMFLTFCVHTTTGMPLSRWGFLAVQAGTFIILFVLSRLLPRPVAPLTGSHDRPIPRWLSVTLWMLTASIVLRALFAGTVFLLLTPAYLDDTLDNWNLRGTVYFHDQAMTLSLPGEDPENSRQTIGSYPPAVPLFKAWTASVAGAWSEPAANAVHLAWFICVLLLVARTVRRLAGRGWDLLSVYLLGSMPLYLMHGTNPYADAFLSLNVLLAVLCPLRALRAENVAVRSSLLRIGAVCAGLLPFTKNEAVLLYLPPLLLLIAVFLFIGWKTKRITSGEVLHAVLWYGGSLLLLTLPWLAFKWMNGLTFGNAKPIGTLGVAYQPGVLIAIAVNTFFEGNWLLFFPLLLTLLIWRFRAAFGRWLALSAFILIIYVGQMLIFLFTPLSVEALMQTGLARGGVQLLPLMTMLVVLLLADAGESWKSATIALARMVGITSDIFPKEKEDAMLQA